MDWTINSVDPTQLAQAPPLLYAVPDYDDSQDATVAQLLQYPGVRTHSFLQNGYTPFVITLKPRPLRDVAGSGVLTSYSPDMSNPWIRTAELATPYYGLKVASLPIGSTSSTVSGYVLITAFVDLEFVNPK